MHLGGVLKLLVDREVHRCHVCFREAGLPGLLRLLYAYLWDVGHEHQRVVAVGEEGATPIVCLGDVQPRFFGESCGINPRAFSCYARPGPGRQSDYLTKVNKTKVAAGAAPDGIVGPLYFPPTRWKAELTSPTTITRRTMSQNSSQYMLYPLCRTLRT